MLSLLIKPQSSECNLECIYCFYKNISKNRNIQNKEKMSENIMENLIKKIFECEKKKVRILFQGGEPLLVGKDFYKKFHYYMKKYNINNIEVDYFIQTNGTLIDIQWIKLFKKYNYLVGVSIDGYKEINDKFRITNSGKGAFEKILKGIKLLKDNKVDYNLLCVVNKLVAKNGKKVYNYLKNLGTDYIQFIPCIDKIKNECVDEDYTLNPLDYGLFLNEVFDEWYNDINNGNFISIRYFENLLSILLYGDCEMCEIKGFCTITPVIEANGDVYPCDFYTLDENKIGNIIEDKFENILFSDKSRNFYKESLEKNEECKKCKYFKLCKGGCKKYTIKDVANNSIKNKFCSSYLVFFNKNYDNLLKLKEKLF